MTRLHRPCPRPESFGDEIRAGLDYLAGPLGVAAELLGTDFPSDEDIVVAGLKAVALRVAAADGFPIRAGTLYHAIARAQNPSLCPDLTPTQERDALRRIYDANPNRVLHNSMTLPRRVIDDLTIYDSTFGTTFAQDARALFLRVGKVFAATRVRMNGGAAVSVESLRRLCWEAAIA